MRATFILLMCCCVGCASSHSIPQSARAPERKVVLGPVVDESGADVSPVLAQRIEEHGLGEVILSRGRTDDAPYVSGTMEIESERRSAGVGALGSGMTSLGVLFAISGFLAWGILAGIADDQEDKDAAAAAGGGVAAIGGGMMAIGIPIWIMGPNFKLDATADAELTIWQAGQSREIELRDEMRVRFDEDTQAGLELFDGVVFGLGSQLGQPLPPAPAPTAD